MHRLSEVVAAALALNDALVDLARGDVVVAAERDVEEALVVAEVEVDLAAIVEDVHLAWGRGGRRSDQRRIIAGRRAWSQKEERGGRNEGSGRWKGEEEGGRRENECREWARAGTV